jgi:hypothetical protein
MTVIPESGLVMLVHRLRTTPRREKLDKGILPRQFSVKVTFGEFDGSTRGRCSAESEKCKRSEQGHRGSPTVFWSFGVCVASISHESHLRECAVQQ